MRGATLPGRFKVNIEDNDSQKRSGENVDQTAEEIAEIISEEAGAVESSSLQAELEATRRALEEEHNRYLRAIADFANYKRRRQEESEGQIKFANQELILKLLPVIDNFERALQAAQVNHNFDGLAEGVSLTLRQLRDMLEKEGVTPIDAVGQEFDPNVHEAVMRIESEDYPDNTVVEELEKGYMQNSRVIRPARVKVATR
jgi:molecular chaperone GrpE